MTLQAYHDFLAQKRVADVASGLVTLPELPDFLFPHQRDIVRWSLRRGRAAVFAGTGLGKTLMELVWARVVANHTGKPTLLLAPLAVSHQHEREAREFGLSAKVVTRDGVADETVITNYQKLDQFDLTNYGGIALDESSILKSYDGHYRTKLIELAKPIPFRLAATATPAPNDFMELGNHAEFLGVMSYFSMLATFFTHDGSERRNWRLKGHAENDFWRWMASWAVMLRKPSDLGYSDEGYELPPLTKRLHVVETGSHWEDAGQFSLLPVQAKTLHERQTARKDTRDDRVKKAVEIVTKALSEGNMDPCGSQNTPSAVAKKQKPIPSIAPSEMLRATEPTKISERNTTASGQPETATTSSDIAKRQPTGATSVDASDTPATTNTGNPPRHQPGCATQPQSATHDCDPASESAPKNMTGCLPHKVADAPSAALTGPTGEAGNFTSTIATTQEMSGDCSAHPATSDLANSPTTSTGSTGRSAISSLPGNEPWLVWCNLNSEHDALEAAFGSRCLSVRGSASDAENERAIARWLARERPIMISKPSMLGFGLNFQLCANMVFVGLNDSFEQVYQAVRRCWRFGQKRPVMVHFIAADTEGAIIANLDRKEADAERMAAAMVRHMADLSSVAVRGAALERHDYQPKQKLRLPAWEEFA
ncbi:helicase-related protein [Mesorhizobium sp. Root102]|uniref:helicase-related protein n=1 Tax=Mesorhizobium sp. Root102 TaxID=1736422 RepID=UPI000AFE90B2|nr:helicase-related protein [Mesorhizobium sp. Root102]